MNRRLEKGSREPSFSHAAWHVELPAEDDMPALYRDQVLRKAWAQTVLQGEGVPTLAHLPVIDGEAEVRLREPREVAERLLALSMVSAKAKGLEQEAVQASIDEHDMRGFLTPRERAFIEDPEPSEHDRIQFSWQCEAAWVLFWALRLLDELLGRPERKCNSGLLFETVSDGSDLARLGLRSANDILNEADLIYRYHWAVRQAGLDGKPPPAGLDFDVTIERHHALNWLICYCDDDWDEVTTDT